MTTELERPTGPGPAASGPAGLAPLGPDRPPSAGPGGRSGSGRRAITWVVVGVVVVALAYGLVLRLWLFAHTPLNSDWAVVGLMAKSILSGHFSTFYWGQHYGGVEPYLVAPAVWLSNGSPWAIEGVPAILSAVAAGAVGLAVGTATGNRRLAWLASAAVWVWPYAVVWNSVREYGFRGVTMACGLLLVYLAVRIHRRGAGVGTGALVGLVGGVGWWSSPEIVYFAVPVAVVLVASWGRLFDPSRRLTGPWRPGPVVAALVGAVVGALPWLYTNVGSGFASLATGSLPSYDGLGYGARLSVFFQDMLPIQLGVRTVPGGAWVGGPATGEVLYGLAVAAVVVVLVAALVGLRHGRRAGPQIGAAAGVLAFPFLYALVPSTGFWVDGRYGVYLPALVVLAAATTLAGSRRGSGTVAPRHVRRGRAGANGTAVLLVASIGLAGAGVLTVFAARAGGVPASPRTFFSGWRDPEAPVRQAAAAMEARGLRDAYGTYWTAYVLDYVAPGRVAVSPSTHDVDRWPAMAARVAAAPRVAWLFFAPGRLVEATAVFGGNTDPGPGGFTEQRFVGMLEADKVPYRVVHLGVLDAVVPARKVTLPG